MKKKIPIIGLSILMAFIFMSGGYGFWEKELTIGGKIIVEEQELQEDSNESEEVDMNIEETRTKNINNEKDEKEDKEDKEDKKTIVDIEVNTENNEQKESNQDHIEQEGEARDREDISSEDGKVQSESTEKE